MFKITKPFANLNPFMTLKEGIKTIEYKPCHTCQHYFPYFHNGRLIHEFSKCRKLTVDYGNKGYNINNVHSGFASLMRSHNLFCGPKGKWHIPRKEL